MPIVSGGATTAAPVEVTEVPPVIPEPSRLGLRNVWTGWDGSVWDIKDWRGGVFLTPGVRGYHMPPVQHYRSESPAVNGSRWRGSRVLTRDAFWPLFLYSAGADQDWIEFDRKFWNTIRPNKLGTWTVIQPTGEQRSLQMRFDSLAEDAFDRDPSAAGWAAYGINFTVEQPFWTGDPIVREFRQTSPLPFFAAPGSGAVLNIAPGSSLSSASIPNPGDEAAWVTWTLQGPFDSAVVGVDGATISVPFPMMATESLTIYTQPDLMQAVDDLGRDRTDDLGDASDFVSVEPGDEVPLTLSLINPTVDSFVGASLIPYYYRAW